jgi:hypothetical protein
MTGSARPGLTSRVLHNIVLRLVIYYAVVGVVSVAAWRVLPEAARAQLVGILAPVFATDLPLPSAADPTASGARGSTSVPAIVEGVSILAAFLVALPMAWVYVFTRQKKGYRQSMVHSLILLPVVVAGVVALVKSSLALAFSLAGVVAAVRFRNTIEDSRDAVYLFLATSLGIAAAVQVDVAAVLSIMSNALVLGLWYTDYGRTPPALEGERARRQLDRALAIASRTSEFVAQVDREVLSGMAPAQLDALERRLQRARDGMGADVPRQRFNARLCVTVTDAEAAKPVLERLLGEAVARWRHRRTRLDDGRHVIEYDVRIRKKRPSGLVIEAIRGEGAPYVIDVRVE